MAKPNLHPCYCPGCQKDLNTTTDLGKSDRVYHCGGCQNYYTGAVWPGLCPVCGDPPKRQRYVKTLDSNEAVPGELCVECFDNQVAMDQAVKDGGVRFQCTGCGKDGVFAASTDFAKRVREETKKPAPQDVFVQIQRCPQCPSIVTETPITDDDSVIDTESNDSLDSLVNDILST